MSWNYAPLWKILIDRNMKRTDLLSNAKIYSQTLAKMGKNEAVSMDALGRICQALDCRIEDVVEFVPEKNQEN
ncbi:helix-turn-helix domain-containing protein [uncultured Flavonifractor sp.]|uniref:helix-turn-helix domain-containing protein n=1 Tax=uncultured Flavonifractor sp. TaxID=1193534 RepID=UPI002613E9A5|nr:helix-turn-helix transcriptional regulator [uncultured Flavonifractor sp.]